MDVYRSGHNGPDSKSGSPHGLVGSNPTASVLLEKSDKADKIGNVGFFVDFTGKTRVFA